MAKSSTIEGLRIVFRHPALGLAEVVWRWSFAVAAFLSLAFLLTEYADSLSVTKGELFLLRSGVPWLVLSTIQSIVLSGIHRFVVGIVIVIGSLSVLWIFAASAGRAASITALLNHCRPERVFEKIESDSGASEAHSDGRASSLLSQAILGLNFLRVALLLVTILAFIGGAFATGVIAGGRHPHPGLAFLLFLVLALMIAVIWYKLNWLLSIAPIFAIRDAEDTWGSISASMIFVRERLRVVTGASIFFTMIHLALFFVASSLVSVPLMFIGLLPFVAIVGTIVLTVLYCAAADFLYVSRLAAYVYILENPDPLPSQAVITAPQLPIPSKLLPADEDDILSDIPGLVPPPEPA